VLRTRLWQRLERHLEIQKPDHDPDEFWELEDIEAAGFYVLHSIKILIKKEEEVKETKKETKTKDFAGMMECFAMNIVSVC
jgi:hypothetical protein